MNVKDVTVREILRIVFGEIHPETVLPIECLDKKWGTVDFDQIAHKERLADMERYEYLAN